MTAKPDSPDVVLGRNLAKRRQRAGLTVRELAAQMGIPHQRIHEIEAATRWPSPERIQAIADALGTTVSKLFAVDK